MIADWVQKLKEKKDKVKIETLNFYESRVYFNPFTSDAIYVYMRNIDIIRLYRRAVRVHSGTRELSMEIRCPRTKQVKTFLLKGDMLPHFIHAVRKARTHTIALSASPRTPKRVEILFRQTPNYIMYVTLAAMVDGEPVVTMMVHHEDWRGIQFYTAFMEEDIKFIRNREYRNIMDYCYNHPIIQMMAELGCDWCYDE